MYCERCKIKKATIHLTEILKNVKSEVHLCDECARDIGLNAKLSDYSLSVNDMLSYIDYSDNDENNFINKSICKQCKQSSDEFKRTGLVGCSDCYFQNKEISMLLNKKFDNVQHIGKIPKNYKLKKENVEINKNTSEMPQLSYVNEKYDDSIINLQKQLDDAVNEERYEEAAIIRDKIKDKEKIYKE